MTAALSGVQLIDFGTRSGRGGSVRENQRTSWGLSGPRAKVNTNHRIAITSCCGFQSHGGVISLILPTVGCDVDCFGKKKFPAAGVIKSSTPALPWARARVQRLYSYRVP